MTEKIILTQEQADAVEYFRKTFVENPKTSMPNHMLIKALNKGYEVKPEFKVGDWVYVRGVFKDPSPEVAKVTNVSANRIVLDNGFDLGRGSITPDTVRHATPSEIAEEKQRRWWAKHGRDVWELKEDDVVKGKGYTTNLWRLGFVKRHYSNVIVLEDISNGSEIEVHKDLSYVVSFKESRLDVKTNG